MPNLIPYITYGELAILSASMTLFLIFPGFLSWGDERRERKRRPPIPLADDSLQLLPTTTTHGEWSAPERQVPPTSVAVAPLSVTTVEEIGIVEGELQAASVAVVTERRSDPIERSSSSVSLPIESADRPVPVLTESPEPLPPPVPAWSRISPDRPETPPTPGRQFHLDELRDADEIAPAVDAADPLIQRSRAWLRAHRSVLSDLILDAEDLAVSRCFAGAVEHDGILYVRFLLFSQLWPAAAEEAEAVAWIAAEDPPAGWIQRVA